MTSTGISGNLLKLESSFSEVEVVDDDEELLLDDGRRIINLDGS